MKNFDDNYWDGLIKSALEEQITDELSDIPSLDELNKKYSPPKKYVRQGLRRLKEKRYGKSLVVVYFQRACVIFFAVVTFAFGGFLLDRGVRASVSNVIVNVNEKFIELYFADNDKSSDDSSDETDDKKDISEYVIGYVPDGFELVEDKTDWGGRDILYRNASGNKLIVTINPHSGVLLIDNEDVTKEYMQINGYDAIVVESEDHLYTTIVFGDSNLRFHLSGDLEKNEMIKVALNIK